MHERQPRGADAPRRGATPDGILLGKDLAAKLGVDDRRHGVVLTPQGDADAERADAADAAAARRRHRSASACTSSIRRYGFVSLDVAKRLLGKDQVDLIQLRVDDIYARAADRASRSRRSSATQYVTQDWADMNKSLFSALWLEKMAISLTIGLIVMVAALNIVASLILLVMEKHRDIAILKTMGASARSVTAIFMMQGLIIGIVGTTVGASAGYAAVVRARPLQADSRAGRRLPGVARAVHACCRSTSRSWSSRRVLDLLRRDDLPVAPGREARSRAGAEIRMSMQPRSTKHEVSTSFVASSCLRDFVACMTPMPFLEARGIVKSYPVGGRR